MVTASALVLAAGGSTRLGRPKQLLDWEGRPLLEGVVRAVSGWPVEDVVVVIGADADAILEAVDFPDEATVLLNEEWEEGMASSLRSGLDVLTRGRGPDWVFIVLADQPHVSGEVPQRLLEAADLTHRLAVVPVYRYQRGNPALVSRALWPRLMSLEGDRGAAGLFEAHPEWVEEVRFDLAMPRDIDTPLDVEDVLPTRRPPSPGAGVGR
jgi:CTP:molybdopterin cytidylyltransferase MocA